MKQCWKLIYVVLFLVCCSDKSRDRENINTSLTPKMVSVSSDSLLGLTEWFISAEPTVSIGASTSNTGDSFQHVTTAAKISTGEILIAETRSRELRIFSQSGQLVRVFGGKGTHRGEFGTWVRLSRVEDDRIGISDFNSRITIYNLLTGQYSVEPIPKENCPGTTWKLSVEGECAIDAVFPDGTLVIGATFPSGRLDPLEPGRLTIFPARTRRLFSVSSGKFTEIDSVLTRTLVRYRWSQVGQMRRGWESEGLFTAKGLMAINANGIVCANSDRYVIKHYNRKGMPIKIIKVLKAPIEVSESMLIPYSTWSDTSETATEPAREYLKSIQPIGYLPFFSEIILDTEDRIWINGYQSSSVIGPATTTSWIIFSAEGQPVAQVKQPFPGDILEIGRDYILVLEKNQQARYIVTEYQLGENR